MAEEKIKLSEVYKTSIDKRSENSQKPIMISTDVKSLLLSIVKNISSVKDNISKLVKIQTESSKSKSFFQKSAEREKNYEEKFRKITTTPVKVGDKTKIKKEEPGFFDFITNIFSFLLKGGVLGILITGIGKILEDPEIRKKLKEFTVDAFVALFNGIKSIVSFIGEILQDPKIIASIVDTVKTIFTVIKDTLLKILNHEVETEYGKFSVGSILLGLVGALVAFRKAIDLVGTALGGLMGKIGGSPTPPTVPTGGPGAPGGPGKPTTPVPPSGGPTTSPGKTTPPTAEPKEKPGFLKTAEDKIRERAEKQVAEKGTKETGKNILKRFFAGALRFGALAGPWGTAYSLYEIADYLSPDEQQQLADSIAVLTSVQQDIDEIEAGPGTKEEKQKRIDILKSRSKVELYEDRLKKLLPPVQALPSAPDESEAERRRLNLKPTTPTPTEVPKSTTPTSTIPTTNEKVITFASLTKEQQDAVLLEQRKQEGFKPGTLSYDLNNPGNMLYGKIAEKYGAIQNPIRGVGEVKGKFAQFPTLEAGTEAQRELWLSSQYANMPLDKAINLWTTGKVEGTSDPGIENYKKAIFASIGKPLPTPTPTTVPETTTVAAAPSIPKSEPTVESKSTIGQMLASMTKDVEFEKELMKLVQPIMNNVTNNNVNNQSQVPNSASTNISVYDDLLLPLIQRTLS